MQEKESVKETYDKIAHSFSRTRYKKWNSVVNFLSSVEPHHSILELCCGNGKNLIDHTSQSIGVDISEELCKICHSRGINVINQDILEVEFEENSFDYIMCIAVIHHFKTKEEQQKIIQKIYKFLKPGGKALITGWNISEERYQFVHGDNYVKFGHSIRYYYIYNIGELKELIENTIPISNLKAFAHTNENSNDTIYFIK